MSFFRSAPFFVCSYNFHFDIFEQAPAENVLKFVPFLKKEEIIYN